MSERLADVCRLRKQVDTLCGEPDYDLEVFATLWQQYQQALESYCIDAVKDQTFESILADNLQWVTLKTSQLTSEREAAAAALLTLSKSKKALLSYGQNN
jgi:hypothetical protein